MNILKLVFELFLIYLAYKLIFEFIIPVYKTTKQMKQKMSDMQQKMQQHQQEQNAQAKQADVKSTDKAAVAGDYIDYEEIK